MDESIHANIKEKLNFYIANGKIPNIVFHGEPFHGKKTLLNYFIQHLYSDNHEVIKKYVMYVNCAHGKGIKFIRDEVKFFAKTHMHCDEHHLFKSIVFLNADHLTIEAQSALRRCIELYSHSTRFFIVLVDKYKLLKPILSRFCEIYVPQPRRFPDGEPICVQNMNRPLFVNDDSHLQKRSDEFTQMVDEIMATDIAMDGVHLGEDASRLYERGFSALDLIRWTRETTRFNVDKRVRMLFTFEKFRREIRNEELLMTMMLHFLVNAEMETQSAGDLENISFM